MIREYDQETIKSRSALVGRVKNFLNKDYRTQASRDAFDTVITAAPENAVCLSIGGGPTREDPKLINLNIGPFPNVDIVADAHELPYRDQCIDNIYCEAVLEHLEDPTKAVGEMWRVIKPGGKVIAVTPFMQGFHGYPYHFQNFTVIGHALKFSKAGFRVIQSGTCVGPMFTVVTVITVFIKEYFPKFLRRPVSVAWRFLGAALLPLDLLLGRSNSSHVLASATYVLAEKPQVQ
jgi:SAM-dependent methyltransferase